MARAKQMTDIWDEKPNFSDYGSVGWEEYLWALENRWLVKLKKQYKSIEEKAEKYDRQKETTIQIALQLELPIDDIEELGHSTEAITRVLSCNNKLEAIKALIADSGLVIQTNKLKEILEAEAS